MRITYKGREVDLDEFEIARILEELGFRFERLEAKLDEEATRLEHRLSALEERHR